MRVALVLLLAAWPRLAAAQSAPDDTLSGPAAVTTPTVPPAAEPDGDQPPAKSAPTPTPAPAAPSWEKRDSATVSVLDKVDGRSASFTVPVGGHQVYRNITLEVRACYARPSNQPPDSAALLVVQDSGAAAPRFSGWMLAAEPAASMMEHPVYDVRVLACR